MIYTVPFIPSHVTSLLPATKTCSFTKILRPCMPRQKPFLELSDINRFHHGG